MFLLLATSTLLELLRLLVRFLNRLANLALLLARLDSNSQVTWLAVLGCFAYCALGFLPVCCAGADFVSSRIMLALNRDQCVGW